MKFTRTSFAPAGNRVRPVAIKQTGLRLKLIIADSPCRQYVTLQINFTRLKLQHCANSIFDPDRNLFVLAVYIYIYIELLQL